MITRPSKWSSRGARLALLAALPLLVGACSGGNSDDGSQDFTSRVDAAIAEAESHGASSRQLEQLRMAREKGSVSLDDARTAALAAIECMGAAGIQAQYSEIDDGSGVLIPSYLASLAGQDQDAASELIDACSRQEQQWISMIYQLQPSTQAVRDEGLIRALPAIRECLATHGVTVDDQATPDEVVRISGELMQSTIDEGGDAARVDCLAESGVTNY